MLRIVFVAAACFAASFSNAQTLTPEEIAAMVDEKLNAQNPYEELLNNPDEERAVTAMEIMLASGDPTLVKMGLEFGLLSARPGVRKRALEAFFNGKPGLTVRLDGSVTEDRDFRNMMRADNATRAPENVGFWRLKVGEYDPLQKCYVHEGSTTCFLAVTLDGVVTNGRSWGGMVQLDEAGALVGSAQLSGIDEAIPISIRLLD